MSDVVVPTIDLTDWASGDADDRARVAREFDAACRGLGFVQIVGHGIPAGVVDGLAAAMDDYFARPAEAKLADRSPRPSVDRGYTAPRSERLSYSLGVATPADLFEAFNVGTPASQHPHLELDADMYAENIWPPEPAGFRPAVEAWFAHAAGLAGTLTEVVALALDLPAGFFTAFADHSIDVLRLNHYDVPAGLELEPAQLGMGAHTDYGILTVLWADAVPGLEILLPDGTWLPVQPAPGALLINLGDLLARWTDDRWTSTMHRVVPSVDAEGRPVRRRSAAFFHDGNADAVISTFASCRTADGPRYDDVTIYDHLTRKLGGSRGLELNEHAAREAARIS